MLHLFILIYFFFRLHSQYEIGKKGSFRLIFKCMLETLVLRAHCLSASVINVTVHVDIGVVC